MPSGGGQCADLLRLERWGYKAARQLGSEAAKRDLDVKTQRNEDAKSITDLGARQSSSLLGREIERGGESNKADLEAKSVSEAAKQLRSEAAKCNILLSPLEGEKKFLGELCELRNFREGYKKYKTLDRATGCAMTDVGEKRGKIKMNENNLQPKQPNNPVASPEMNHSPLTTHHSLKRKVAFTLAEVLITLGIIGVVAALTLPSLLANYTKTQTVVQLKKSYSVLEQTIKNAENDYGEVNNWPEWDDAESILSKYFVPYLQGAKEFGKIKSWDKNICYTPGVKTHVDNLNRTVQYTFLSGMHVSGPFYANKTASIQLNDGTCIGLNPILDLNENASYSALFSRLIFIDVNGTHKAPNVVGKDLFLFYVNSNGVIKPFGDIWSRDKILSSSFNLSCNTKSILGGHSCAYRIMQEGWKINYY